MGKMKKVELWWKTEEQFASIQYDFKRDYQLLFSRVCLSNEIRMD